MIPQTLAGSRSGRRVPAAIPSQPGNDRLALPPQPRTIDADLFNARYADSPASRDALLQKVPLRRFGQPEDAGCCSEGRGRSGWSARVLHYTPTYSSWLNQVELWFSKIERDVIARGVFTSVTDLRRKLMRYIKQYNKTAKPVRWAYADPTRRIA
jgi:hypothetical protein